MCGSMITAGQCNEFITVVIAKSIRGHLNEQLEISLFCTGHLTGWISKCWNLLFQFCCLISFYCLAGPAFSKRTVKTEPKYSHKESEELTDS